MIVRQFFTWLIFLSLAQGCAQEARPLPTVQWQFIDADTMQPIEGAFVNFFWRGKADSRGFQTCKYAGLGRSDKDGWFRHTALDPSWREDALPAFFVPGYEFLTFKYGYPDKDHITAYIAQDANQEYGKYPAFEKRWAAMGYTYQGEKSAYYLDWHAWTKLFPANGFHDRKKDYIYNNPRRYLVKLRSAPPDANAAFPFVGKTCGDADAVDGVDVNVATLSDYLRNFYSTKYFCDSAMDSLAPNGVDSTNWMIRAFYLIPNEKMAQLNSKEDGILKDFQLFHGARNLTASERAKFCDYVQQFLKPGDKL